MLISRSIVLACTSSITLAACYASHELGVDAGLADLGADVRDFGQLDLGNERCFVFDNPSFEDPVLMTSEGSTTARGWTQVEGNIDILISNEAWGVALDGRNFIDINGTDIGVIEQTHATNVGEAYAFIYATAANGANLPFVLRVLDSNGTVLLAQNGTGHEVPSSRGDWNRQRVSFVATTATTTVQIESLSSDPVRGANFDDFRCPEDAAP